MTAQSNDQPRRFAVELSTAIAVSGLSLSQICAELARRGHSVTPAALSYWKTGRSLPRRASSRPIIRELENVLDVPHDSFTLAVSDDLRHTAETAARIGYPYAADTQPDRLDHEDTRRFDAIAAAIDWDSEVNRRVFEETMTVSADFRSITLDTISLVRIPNRPKPTYHVGCFWEPDQPITPESLGIHDLEGVRLTGIEQVEATATQMARMEIPPSFAEPGSIHRIAYTHRFATGEPFDEAIQRLFLWPLRFYTCRLIFAGKVPSTIRWEMTTIEADERSERRMTTIREVEPAGSTVQVALENVASSLGLFTWEW